MTGEIAFLLVVLAGMAYLFLTERLPVDLTAFLGLVVLLLTGYLTPAEAFQGFSSSAVITMLSIFIVSGAMLHTGLADVAGSRLHAWVGGGELRLLVTLMLLAGVLSAFMNNIAATAVLMPAVASLARRAEIAPSRLFMPLSFGAILGGTTTLVGTPPNILTGELLADAGLEPFELFDFTPVGLILLGSGVLYMATVGRRLLPTRAHGPARPRASDLARLYELEDRLFSIRLPEDSELDGKTLGETQLGSTLGVQVLAVLEQGRRRLAPTAETRLAGGDTLLVEGRRADVEELFRMQGMEVTRTHVDELPPRRSGVGGVRARLREGSPLVGRSIKELRFRDRFGITVVGLRRDGEMRHDELADLPLAAGDEILGLGTRGSLETLSRHEDFAVHEVGLSAVRELARKLFLLRLPGSSPLIGRTIAESRLGELTGVTVAGLLRGDETRLAVSPEETLEAGDRLLIAGEPSKIVQLIELGEVRLDGDYGLRKADLESAEVGVVELTLAPRSSAAGQTLAQLDFRDRHGLQVIALWREGEVRRTRLAEIRLRFGDALLVQGRREHIRRIARDPDWVVLSETVRTPRRTAKAPLALGGLLLMVGMVVSGFQPIHVAAFTAASLLLLVGTLTMQEAYRAVEWRAIFLVAAVLPMGTAMERSGAALLMAETVRDLAGPLGPHTVLAAMVVLSSLLSQALDGAPAVVLLTPVALETATQLGISPYPIMMGIGLAASAAYMTPFSHKANLLVMGAGGYRATDYVKVGTPLTLVQLLLLVLVVPLLWSF